MGYDFATIERTWQAYWAEHRTFRALDPSEAGDRPKAYVLDMFPYPSGAGLHVGHPEGYTATDIYSRYLRMKGYNVLHPMGWDAFGLPAEQYALKTGTHPAVTTGANVDNFRRQIQSLGLSYDWEREVDTTDPAYVRWTQWIFLQLFNSRFDPEQNKAVPMRPDDPEDIRLAYAAEVPVNWCPALGTVLANEEVIDGRSEVGRFPVERRPMRQWMLRITAYAERLLADLDLLDWPASLKEMQRNWIGRSTGAEIDFVIRTPTVEGVDTLTTVTVFTTRPDTLFGATYLVLAPEHPFVDVVTTPECRDAVSAYRSGAANRSERDRISDAKQKTGVFTGAYAINPVNGESIPVWIADYVLMGYGTGAIMAVPAHDERDDAFARTFDLPIRAVVRRVTEDLPAGEVFVGEGVAIHSGPLDGLPTAEAKERVLTLLEGTAAGRRRTTYKLRDWLFSRQRYWGEPFPLLIDEDGRAHAVAESELPVLLPKMSDFKPTGTGEPPLAKAVDWVNVERNGRRFRRETNTMPQWAGSCWYYLRYIDPQNAERFVDPEKERYWMPVDLYVGGVEHAVLHLLYARFWHKVLYDLGHVSTPEPFQRLVNQGLILGETEYAFFEVNGRAVSATEFRDVAEEATPQGPRLAGIHRGTGETVYATPVIEPLVEKRGDRYVLKADPSVIVDARSFKMSKSRGNVINPDAILEQYGADCFRLYEMYMGPLEQQKPWNTRDIVGMRRFLDSVWRHLVGDEETGSTVRFTDGRPPEAFERILHRTIKKVAEDVEGLRFNVAIAELIKLNNEIGRLPQVPEGVAETFTLLLAPFAPHLAEELWRRWGHADSLSSHPWPMYDEAMLTDPTLVIPVQVNGKVRGRVEVAKDADESAVLTAALADDDVRPWVEGKPLRKRVYVPGRLVNLVV